MRLHVLYVEKTKQSNWTHYIREYIRHYNIDTDTLFDNQMLQN